MTLLEALRQLMEDGSFDEDWECLFCGMRPSLHNVEGWKYGVDPSGRLHYPDCPWQTLVAALHAEEAPTG